MKHPRMYNDLAHLWPIVSPPEDYAEEAGHWLEVLRANLGPGRHRILDLGVGGGHNLSHLTSDFEATAVDLSPRMIENSKALNPGVEHYVGDMRSVRLGEKFAAVLIHDAIDYLLTEEDVKATFATAAEHLEKGGILVIAPDWYKDDFPGVWVTHNVHGKRGLQVALFEYTHDSDPADTKMESIFLFVIKEGKEVRVEKDIHTWVYSPLEPGLG